MPLRDFHCETCGQDQERFFHPSKRVYVDLGPFVSGRAWEDADPVYPPCQSCGGRLDLLPLSVGIEGKSGVFPFVNPHIQDPATGQPVRIESIGHLRAVEKQYGVVMTAFSNNPSNPSPVKDPPVYRGYNPYRRDRRSTESD